MVSQGWYSDTGMSAPIMIELSLPITRRSHLPRLNRKPGVTVTTCPLLMRSVQIGLIEVFHERGQIAQERSFRRQERLGDGHIILDVGPLAAHRARPRQIVNQKAVVQPHAIPSKPVGQILEARHPIADRALIHAQRVVGPVDLAIEGVRRRLVLDQLHPGPESREAAVGL